MKHQEQKTILLVEDDTVTTMVETHLLKSLGYDVVAAKSGEEAVQVATCNDKIALILMDIELGSGMNGAEAAKQILGKRHLPIVFLTVHTDKEYVERIKGIAGYGCIIKNSGDVVLQSSIEMAFNLFSVQKAMRKSEEKYRSLVENINDVVFTVDIQGLFTYMSPVMEGIIGYTPEEMIGQSFSRFIFQDDLPMLMARFHMLLAGEIQPADYRVVTKTGDVRWVRSFSRPVIVDGKAVAINGLISDITERRRMEDEIIKISMLEKQGMARDLHDGLAQQLAGAAYLCRVLKDQLTSASQKKAAQEIDVVLHQCLQQIHNVAVGLLPVGLEYAGLVAALQNMAKTISKMFSVNCRLEQSGAPATFDLKTSTHLYYLVQEAVMNATRHGSPRNIVISFDYRLEQLTVQDDGSGFDLAPAGKGGMGLQIMRYRANIIGGELAIDSHKGGGTRIRCKFARQVGIPAGRDMIGNVRETNAGD